MALQAENIADLLITTQKNLGRLKWTNIAYTYQEYAILPQLLQKQKVKFDSGTSVQWNVLVAPSTNAAHVGLFYTQNTNVTDGAKTADIPWRHTKTAYAVERRELAMNRNPSKVVDLMEERRAQAMIDMANVCETGGFNAPAASNDTDPFGIFYWLVYNATVGFTGGNHANFAAGPGGLSATTYAQWKNFSGLYAAVTKADLIATMRQGATKTMWKSPIKNLSEYNQGPTRRECLVDYTTMAALELVGEAANENLGRDIAPYDGGITFRKNPVRYIPFLDTYTANTNPVVLIDWAYFYPVFLSGEYMVEQNFKPTQNQPTTFYINVDLTWNIKCCDRRRHCLFAKA